MEETPKARPRPPPITPPNHSDSNLSPAPRKKTTLESPRTAKSQRISLGTGRNLTSPKFNFEATAPTSPRTTPSPKRRFLVRNSTDPSFNLPPLSGRSSVKSSRGDEQLSKSMKIPSVSKEIINYKHKALNLMPLDGITDSNTFNEIIYLLSCDRKKAVAAKAFSDGEALTQAIEFTRASQTQWLKDELKRNADEAVKSKMEEVNTELEAFDNETDRLSKELDNTIDLEYREMQMRHDQEINDNEELWRSEAKIKHYNHASPALLNTKKQLNFLLVQCRFKEAEEVQKIFDRQKAECEDEARMKMQADYNNAAKIILQRQIDEVNKFERDADIRRDKLQVDRAKEREAVANRLRKIDDIAEKSAKIPKTRAIIEAPLPTTTITRGELKDTDVDVLNIAPLDFRRDDIERMRQMRKADL